jgi:signal transduction histidine kinase
MLCCTAADTPAIGFDQGESLWSILTHAPSPYAVTGGATHTVVYANPAFRRLVGELYSGQATILDMLLPEAVTRVRSVLDRSYARGEVIHNRFLGTLARGDDVWSCAIWPICDDDSPPRGLVLELHRLEKAHGGIRFNQVVEVRAQEAVARAVAMIGDTLSRKSLTYSGEPEGEDAVAKGDGVSMNQILVNLLANAVKFTPRGGSVMTQCETAEDQVRIHVIDTGIGIAPSRLESIFEHFVQRDEAYSVACGVGLGLANSRELARSMQGDLSVESELGKGARFTLSLPRANWGNLGSASRCISSCEAVAS